MLWRRTGFCEHLWQRHLTWSTETRWSSEETAGKRDEDSLAVYLGRRTESSKQGKDRHARPLRKGADRANTHFCWWIWSDVQTATLPAQPKCASLLEGAVITPRQGVGPLCLRYNLHRSLLQLSSYVCLHSKLWAHWGQDLCFILLSNPSSAWWPTDWTTMMATGPTPKLHIIPLSTSLPDTHSGNRCSSGWCLLFLRRKTDKWIKALKSRDQDKNKIILMKREKGMINDFFKLM